MPYYRDILFEPNESQTAFTNAKSGVTAVQFKGVTAKSVKVTTGFRTRPKDDNSVLVSDQTADPYAYFLSETRRQDYLAALSARDMTDISEPDRGHAFDSYSHTFRSTTSTGTSVFDNGNRLTNVQVPLLPAVGGVTGVEFDTAGPFRGNTGNVAIMPASDLSNFAQRGIAKTSPTLAEFSLAAFLGELREGLPKMIPNLLNIKKRTEIARAAGGDYLNVVFGWVPLLNDISALVNVLANASEVLSGRPIEGVPIRRTWGLPVQSSEYSISGSGGSSYTHGIGWRTVDSSPLAYARVLQPTDRQVQGGPSGPTGTFRLSKVLTRRQWFVGSYVTFLPLGFDPSSYEDKLKALIDPRITPATLWQLAPWSWLTDWVFHIGDSIDANSIAGDELIHIRYAYAMEQTTCQVFSDFDMTNNVTGSGTSRATHFVAPSQSSVTTTVRKRRIRANPFGFTSGGMSGLKPGQVAILAALGLTKT